MGAPQPPLHLQYGVNAFAEDVYKTYKPLLSTAHYPDPFCTELRHALAGYTGMSEDMILVASGSDELIDIYIRMYKAQVPELKVAFSPPTYPQYEAYTARENVRRILLPHERRTITAELLQDMGGDPLDTIVMLDSPANPSGETMNETQFLGILDAGFKIFADEAYFEFHGHTLTSHIARYPMQLVVSRSLSKFAAMAGSRVGYLLASAEMVNQFRDQQLFFNVNSEGQHRALHALQNVDALKTAIEEMRKTKRQVDEAIKELGAYDVFPALDMYTIFKHHTIPTEKLHQTLQDVHAINTTRFPAFKEHDVIRSTILQMPLMQQLVNALAQYA